MHVMETRLECKIIYYQVTRTDYFSSLADFKEILAKTVGQDSIVASLQSFKDVFSYIARAMDQPYLFVIDEFPLLAMKNKDVANEFQWIIDHGLSQQKIVLLGSQLSFMKNLINDMREPLYGRFDAILEVVPFTFEEVQKIFPNHDDAMAVYATTGGVAQYVMFYMDYLSVDQGMENLFFTRNGRLRHEAENLLMMEMRDPSRFMDILRAISSTPKTTSYISSHSGVENKNLSAYLNKLMQLQIVSVSESEFSNQKKDKRYEISDIFFRFHLTFIDPNDSLITRIEKKAMDLLLPGKYEEYLGVIYESIVRDRLFTLGIQGIIPFIPLRAGKWWGMISDNGKWKESEIDIISYDDHNVIFGECKHRNKLVGVNELDRLKLKATFVPTKGRNPFYLLESKNGFSKELLDLQYENLILMHGLDVVKSLGK